MRCHQFLTAVVLTSAVLLPADAWAQARNPSGSTSGLFGSRSVGSGLQGANRSFGGAGSSALQAGSVGQITGNERFVRGNQQQGQFIGGDARSVEAFFDTITGGRGGSAQRNFRNNNQNRGRQPNAGGRGGQNRLLVRTRLRAAFARPPIRPDRVSAQLQQRLQRVLQPRSGAISEVVLQNGTAILRGVVANPYDRLVAEKLALLEPGILEIQNELRVTPPAEDQLPREDSASQPQQQ